MYTVSTPQHSTKSKSFENLKDARQYGIKFFPNVKLTNKKGVVLPL